MKLRFTLCAIGCMGLLAADATALDVSDPDAAGAEMVACWHPGDRHVGTTLDVDWGKVKEAIETFQVLCLLNSSTDPETDTGIGHAETIWKGHTLGIRYVMNTRMDHKYVCKNENTVEVWGRIMNVHDGYPPQDCYLETWRKIDTYKTKGRGRTP